MSSEEMWSIFDTATEQWWGEGQWTRRAEFIKRFFVYTEAVDCAAWTPPYRRARARIVEAPVLEMTDTEAWTWFRASQFYMHGGKDAFFLNKQNYGAEIGAFSQGNSPENAIRAARKRNDEQTVLPTVLSLELEQCATLLELRANAIDSSRCDAQTVLREMAKVIRSRKI